MLKSEILENAINIYKDNLWINPGPLNYLIHTRKLNEEILRKFNVGFCSNNLVSRYSDKEGWYFAAQECGVVNSKGYDFFNGYTVVPITSENYTCNIYGRVVNGNGIPHKMLPSIKKSNVFNEEALLKKSVLIVESIIDALTLIQYGFNACALTGVQLTKDMAKEFKDKNCYLLFDSDYAGKLAINNVAYGLLSYAKEIYEVKWPETTYKIDVNTFFTSTNSASSSLKYLIKNSVAINKRIFTERKKIKNKKSTNVRAITIGHILFDDEDKLEKDNGLWVRCPHHNEGKEKNRSLWIGGERNGFYCFGCQVGGDAVQLVSWHLGISENDALEWLSELG